MPRTKEEQLHWEGHRDELRSLWLDQRWTAEQIQGHMSQRHGFCRSIPQYTRQFQKWGFQKNSKGETWKFVFKRREKRKREGKDPGQVWRNGKHIPEEKVRKEISRHVPLLSQYWDSGEAGVYPSNLSSRVSMLIGSFS
ncbi:hypothetical protein ASPCAL00249 [Aspergillus calidoustus]|uniref:Clr5 domain-containing protein n=1 Tax=Aspergillus calidoustus TaxID=454130 RepID=A0A0U5FMZ4_ASPCI|nr:hypothetical protein ASPCAL00249 [Aspergillus calidoustus]